MLNVLFMSSWILKNLLRMEFTSNHYPGAQLPGGEELVLPAVSLKIEKK